MTTDNENIVNNVWGGIPVTYEKRSASKNIIKEENLYKSDILAFDPKIGFITNTSSTMYALLVDVENRYGKDSQEYKMLLDRLKICRKNQGDTIDSAKGIVVKDFPTWWTNFVKLENVDDEEKDFYKVSNNILITSETRPYFFKYLYSDYATRHGNKSNCFDERSIRTFKKPFGEILESDDTGENIDFLIQDYHKKFGFIDNDSAMNVLCHYMENSVKRIKAENVSNENLCAKILMSSSIEINEEKLKKIDNLYKNFIKTKRNFVQNIKKQQGINEKYKNIEQIYKQFRIESEKISSSSKELANLSVELCYLRNKSYEKEFVWKIFYNGLIENIIENKSAKIFFPVLSEDGDINYLGKKYKNVEVDIFDF